MLWIQRPQGAKHKAIISQGKTYTYGQLQDAATQIAGILLGDKADLNEARVAFLITPGFDYVQVQWGIWLAGGVAVPLCTTHPLPALKYTLQDTGARLLVINASFHEFIRPLVEELNLNLFIIEDLRIDVSIRPGLPEVHPDRRAMILYTSGTTSLPKGVVTTHATIAFQIECLVHAWKWSAHDHTLCVLPLHHVHGIINVVSCALWSGACVEFLPHFNTEKIIKLFEEGNINVFMAVPTIYFKLITHIESLSAQHQQTLFEKLKKFRLMVSGSAALPVSVMETWAKLSGHRLLERYGMTEIGMGLSNPYEGERRAGTVGQPLPGVGIRLVDEYNKEIECGTPGEIQVKGPNVFKEYWQRPEATTQAFTPDGWFKTGDVAVLEEGYYRILGRESQDIIKSGGYKISALEIEEVIRTYPGIKDVSVVGIADDEWGEIIAAALILDDKRVTTDALQHWLRHQIPGYKVPRQYKVVTDLPRNAMGKVVKGDLKKLFN